MFLSLFKLQHIATIAHTKSLPKRCMTTALTHTVSCSQCTVGYHSFLGSIADLDPFDTDPDHALHFDTDPDPAFHFDTDPDPTV